LAPIFVRNHKSWEDDEAAQAALWPEVAKMLWRGVLEYVARHCRLPLCIMACGAVPKGDRTVLSSHYRLSTNQRVCRSVAGKIHINGRTRSAAIAGLFLLGD
jgi:hypothetical protein